MDTQASLLSRVPFRTPVIGILPMMLPAFLAAAQPKSAPNPAIKVDQVGYLPAARKIALVAAPGTSFRVLRMPAGTVALAGKLGAATLDPDTGDQVAAADFSKLTKSGDYCLEVPGVGRSWNFRIAPDAFTRTYYLGMRAFYGQRCGMAVDLGAEFPDFKYPACHLHGEYHASSGKTGRRDNVGGWHDAGDYGRYVVNSSISVANLMWAWELYGPKLQKISLKIPESGSGTPDLLAEVRWNLEWMLKMQDEDGGVFHKQTSESFIGFVAPDADKTISYVVGIGEEPFKTTAATADLAASAAIAARVYRPFDAAFADKCLKAAEKSWEWAIAHPSVPFKNPKGVQTGEYGDARLNDELLWAAGELWRSTGKQEYNDYFLGQWASMKDSLAAVGDNWSEMAPMGLWTYAMAKGGDPKVIEAIKQESVASARKVVDRTLANGYRVSLSSKEYIWGSTCVAATYGIHLLMADHFSPDPRFREAAADNLHYLLGRNTFSLSFVTQVGANPFSHPHHRPSGATGKPWPGLISGGPNAGRQDDVLAKLPKDLPPAKVFVDDQGSYAGNEIAINWQSAFVFLVASQLP
jgi:endoglucanase